MNITTAVRSSSVHGVRPLYEHYRCADEVPDLKVATTLKAPMGYFRFGETIVCYGQTSADVCTVPSGLLHDVSTDITTNGRGPVLPFDPAQVINNLRFESYALSNHRLIDRSWIKEIYYWLRPLLPVTFRKHLQKIYLRDWERIAFPAWPLDRTVDLMLEKLLVLTMRKLSVRRLPFIWFWPEGRQACAIMTHDVETAAGRDFSAALMDIDDEFEIPASFQIVPEKRYGVPASYLDSIRKRGFEVNVQGLDHDGNLFEHRDAFLEKAKRINRYALEFDAVGFRSPILYRNVNWFQDLNFSYDMSVPNVARLEAQRGGCCTIMPYFLPGGVTELPVTMVEDYTLFHILKDYSTNVWKQQMDMVLAGNGLMNFIIHPDYVTADRPRRVYRDLLDEIRLLRADKNVWVCLPREVDRWWRERRELELVGAKGNWKISGKGSERARIAYARLDDDRVVYEIESSRSGK